MSRPPLFVWGARKLCITPCHVDFLPIHPGLIDEQIEVNLTELRVAVNRVSSQLSTEPLFSIRPESFINFFQVAKLGDLMLSYGLLST